jgi:hypothetical protein
MSGMDWMVVPSWIAAFAAVIAAFASVAVWRHQRGSVVWKFELPRGVTDRCRVINTGSGTAFKIHVRIGSASDPSDNDVGQERRRERVNAGEAISFSNTAPMGCVDDFSVSITWHSRLGRKHTWAHPLV